MAVTGACVVPATTAPMPIMAYASGEAVTSGRKACTNRPNSPPATTPRNSDGEKMPPDAPEPSVMHVAASLRRNRASSTCQARVCCSRPDMASKPVPYTSGASSSRTPTPSPPTAVRASGGMALCSNRSSLLYSVQVNATATSPIRTPSRAYSGTSA